MTARWIAFCVACLVVATAAFGAGAGTVALFSDSETISGSFSVEDDRDHRVGPWSTNGTEPDGGSDPGNGSDAGTNGSETAPPNGTTGKNETAGENGTAPGNGTAGGNGTIDGGNETAGDGGNATDGGNASDGGNGTDAGNASDTGNDTDGDAGGASVAVTSVELTNSEVTAGEESGVRVTVQNDRNVTASFTASLTVGGEQTTSGRIDLAPDEQSTLSLRHTFQSPGEYEVRAAGVDAGSVTVVEPAPELSIDDAAAGTGTVAPNETVSATATVTNDGTASGTEELALTVDGAVVGTASVTVAAGSSETVSFSHSFPDEGTYALAVDGVSAGTVEVVGPSNGTSPA